MAISGRLPMDYGKQTEIKSGKGTGGMTNTNKTNAEGSPKAKAKQDEGRAGRVKLGESTVGVKYADMNKERAKAK